MPDHSLNIFVALIKNQFREEDRDLIDPETDLRTLKEWSSLQTMIIVNEIDKEYNVILGFEDIKNAANVAQLFETVQNKLS
jgi:acyl carrier protein